MSKTAKRKNIILAVIAVIAVAAGLILLLERGLQKIQEPAHNIPSKPVIKGVDPLLAIKGCLFDMGVTRGDAEFSGDKIIVKVKEKIPEDRLEEFFKPMKKIGRIEIRDDKHVIIVMDSRRWEIEIVYPSEAEPAIPEVIKPGIGKKARIAIIIDDMGLNLKAASRLAQIDRDLSFSVLPYTEKSKEVASYLHSRGCDVLVHVPMEGVPGKNPGRGAILSDMDKDEVLAVLEKDLNNIPYAIGASNHMGSKITQDRDKMTVIINELKRRDMFYIDSMTSPNSICLDVSKDAGEPFARRDVFLDNELNEVYITGQLDRLKRIAMKNGYAIGICHPHEETIAVLEKEIPRLRAHGIELEPVSKFVKKR
ncbi:MAG TPA: divergent polysaccharide deacetylase family protein [Desulfomonilia bacterium]